ncbi:MAG: flagellar basal body-associated FliL family protein [Acidithiobacillus sp.]
MKKKLVWIMGAMALLLMGGGGAWWWMHHGHAPRKPPSVVSDLPLPEFTLSVKKKGGMSGYLVMDLVVAVKGPDKLPKSWMAQHDPQVRAAVLSSLLNLPDVARANSSKPVRDAVRKAVASDMNRILRHGYATSSVYITKLIVQ